MSKGVYPEPLEKFFRPRIDFPGVDKHHMDFRFPRKGLEPT